LEEGFVEETPEGIQFLLRMWHVLQFSFGFVDTLRDIAGEVLKEIRQAVFLRGSLARSGLMFGIGSDMAVRVQALDDSFGFVEDPSSFFNKRTNFADKRFLVALVLGGTLGLVNFLACVSALDDIRLSSMNDLPQ